jgi:hypothetical protein
VLRQAKKTSDRAVLRHFSSGRLGGDNKLIYLNWEATKRKGNFAGQHDKRARRVCSVTETACIEVNEAIGV